jgi:hypothetical protein
MVSEPLYGQSLLPISNVPSTNMFPARKSIVTSGLNVSNAPAFIVTLYKDGGLSSIKILSFMTTFCPSVGWKKEGIILKFLKNVYLYRTCISKFFKHRIILLRHAF